MTSASESEQESDESTAAFVATPDGTDASSNKETSVSPVTPQLSLAQSISIALAQNPDLTTLRQTENVSRAALGVAQTYPFNPFIQFQVTPFQYTQLPDHGTNYHYVLLMQQIQLAHQQQYREEVGTFALNSTRWNIHQAELQNVAQTERLYFTALYLRGLFQLAKAGDDNNQQLLQALEKQLAAGQATAAEVAIVRVDARSTKQQVRLANANYLNAIRDLKRHLGICPTDPLEITGDLKSFQWIIPPGGDSAMSLETEASPASQSNPQHQLVVSRALSRPDVMAAHSDIDVARSSLSLASASKIPDLQIGPYYQRTADGITFLGFRAHMDIPVLNSGQPLENQRVAEFSQRIMAWQQLQRRAELEAEAACERYELALEALAEDTADGVEDVLKELEGLERQFIAGEVDVVRVVQARTSIIQNQRVRLDILNEVAQSSANLTAVTGMSIEELTQQSLIP